MYNLCLWVTVRGFEPGSVALIVRTKELCSKRQASVDMGSVQWVLPKTSRYKIAKASSSNG